MNDALRQSDERIRRVLDAVSEGFIMAEFSGRLVFWNRAALEMHGYQSMDEVLLELPKFIGRFEFFTLDNVPLTFEAWPLSRVLRDEPLRDYTLRVRRTDVAWERVYSYSGGSVQDASGQRLAFLTITDQTARHSATEALLSSEVRLREANEVAGIGTYETDVRAERTRLSPELCEFFGLPLEQAEMSLAETLRRVHPDDLELVKAQLAAMLDASGTRVARLEFRILRPNGELRWGAWRGRAFFEDTPEGAVPTRMVGAILDITEQRRAARRLTTQSAVSSALADDHSLRTATPTILRALCESEDVEFAAIWEVDTTREVLVCADVWSRPGLCLDELAAKTRALVLAPGVGLAGRSWQAQRPLWTSEVAEDPTYLRAREAHAAGLHGALAFPIITAGVVTGVVDFLGRNIPEADAALLGMFEAIGRQLGSFYQRKREEAERRRLEAQLRQSQKMEAIGQLSGGVAHDFNNVLAAILGNVELARLVLTADHPASDNLREIDRAATRAKELVRQILTFAMQRPQERQPIELVAVVAESLKLLRASLPAGVEIAFRVLAEPPTVLADPTQIQQIVLNLVTNAWQSMHGQTGRIEVTLTRAEQATRTSGSRPEPVQPGDALLSVKDDGSGMDAQTLERIFEPFFTTKPPGSGTGLGLAVVHGIVQSHGGSLSVDSTPGVGTTFHLYLPACVGVRAQPSVPALPRPGSGEPILYIDDDQAVASVTRQLLTRLGYRVTAFARPSAAIEAFRRAPDAFAVVLSDMNMPEMTGIEACRAIMEVRSGTPCVLTTGRVTEELTGLAQRSGIRLVIEKPARMDVLSRVLRELLDETTPPPDVAVR